MGEVGAAFSPPHLRRAAATRARAGGEEHEQRRRSARAGAGASGGRGVTAGPLGRSAGETRARAAAKSTSSGGEAPCTCTGVWRARRAHPAARSSGPARRRGARSSIPNAASRAALPSLVRKPDCVGSASAPLSKPRPRAQPPHLRRGSETRARAAAKTTSSAAPSGPTSPHGGGARISEKPRGFHRCPVANVRLLHMLVGRFGA